MDSDAIYSSIDQDCFHNIVSSKLLVI